MNNKKIAITIMGIMVVMVLINTVFAASSGGASKIKISVDGGLDTNFFAGETIVKNLEVCNEYSYDKEVELTYEVVGNEYDLEGIDFEFSDNEFKLRDDTCEDIDFTITTQETYKADDFTLRITADITSIANEDGGDSWIYGECEWNCDEWRTCVDSVQTRDCSKTSKYCVTKEGTLPLRERGCIVGEKINLTPTPFDTEKTDAGNVTDDTADVDIDDTDSKTKTWWTSWWFLALIFIITLFIILFIVKVMRDSQKAYSDEDDDEDEPKPMTPLGQGPEIEFDKPSNPDDYVEAEQLPTSTAEELIGEDNPNY